MTIERKQPLLYRCAGIPAAPGTTVHFGIEISSSGWDRHAGGKMRPFFAFTTAAIKHLGNRIPIYTLFDEAMWQRVVEGNNAIATRPPGCPPRGETPFARPDYASLYEAYARRFEPSFPGRLDELWLRYRAPGDVAFWAGLIGAGWEVLCRELGARPPPTVREYP